MGDKDTSFDKGYEKLKELGRGRYGIVYMVRRRKDGRSLAAKHIRTRREEMRQKAMEEISILKDLRDSRIVGFVAAFEEKLETIIVTEFVAGGELFEKVSSPDFTLTEAECVLFVTQICQGVAYLHRMKVVHLDLKPENIMLCDGASEDIKIVDFGLARRLTNGKEIKTMCGTPEFVAPEIVNFDPVGPETDVWAIGVITYVLLSGLSPFLGDSDNETYSNIVEAANLTFDEEEFDDVSHDAKSFICCLVVKDKRLRLSAKECLSHSWLSAEGNIKESRRKILKTDNLRKFLIRRRWQKCGQAIRAMKRISSMRLRSTSSPSISTNETQTKTCQNGFQAVHRGKLSANVGSEAIEPEETMKETSRTEWNRVRKSGRQIQQPPVATAVDVNKELGITARSPDFIYPVVYRSTIDIVIN